MQILVVFVFLLLFQHAQSTHNKPWSTTTKFTHVPAVGGVNTTDFIKLLERNVTSYIQMCCKDCSNSSLSLSSEVHSWPITTKADVTSLIKDIKRSITYQVQLLSVGMECQADNRSHSMLAQLQASLRKEIDTKVAEQIESNTKELREDIILLTNKSRKYELETTKMITELAEKTQNLEMDVRNLKLTLDKPYDCDDLPEGSKSGVYEIFPEGRHGFKTYCEMEVDGGGWTVFQRRITGEVDFYRTWNEYKMGFGDSEKEFWLGNDRLNKLTFLGYYKLRIDITYYDTGIKQYAVYSTFYVEHETTGYKLTIGGYSGTAGDALTTEDSTRNLNGMKFSTKYVDNDKSAVSCAEVWQESGFWFNACTNANLNGPYKDKGPSKKIFWRQTSSSPAARLSYTMMMIKRN